MLLLRIGRLRLQQIEPAVAVDAQPYVQPHACKLLRAAVLEPRASADLLQYPFDVPRREPVKVHRARRNSRAGQELGRCQRHPRELVTERSAVQDFGVGPEGGCPVHLGYLPVLSSISLLARILISILRMVRAPTTFPKKGISASSNVAALPHPRCSSNSWARCLMCTSSSLVPM